MCLFRFSILYVFLCVSLDYFIPVLLAFNVLGLVLQYQAKIGWEERLQTDIFCIEWDVKP